MQSIVDAELALISAGESFDATLTVDKGRDNLRRYGPFAAPLDFGRLRALAGDAGAYGQALAAMLFADAALREALAGAREVAADRGVPLRLRLAIPSQDGDLNGLRWELLRLPGRAEPLATREDILFSRYLSAGEDAPPPRPKGSLRALAAIAAPSDAAQMGFSPIDAPFEAARARDGLAGMEIEWLPGSLFERCTLARLAEKTAGKDVLYLVCHGKVIDGQGWLLLENDDGSAARTVVDDLVTRLAGRMHLPRLAVLVVCESAGGGGGVETLSALGPRLVEVGIPAVIAMQGSLTAPTAGLYLPALFSALNEDGVIDRAASAARRAVLDQPDESAPVLYMSLKSGRLWSAEPAPEPAAHAAGGGPAGGSNTGSQNTPGSAGAPAVPAEKVDQRVLYAALSGPAFSLEDLEQLCFLLNVDWQNLRGETKPVKAMSMIRYFASRGEYARLVEAVRAARENLGI